MKRVAKYFSFLLLALPVAFIVTILMSRFWNWFEGASGIESYGHSGPADWCYIATYIVVVSLLVIYDRFRTGKS